MNIDPTAFLSTIVAASVALVAIIGGLLVARFVGLDSDQRTSRRVLADASERLDAARSRATAARQAVLRWDAGIFFRSPPVVAAAENGVTSVDELMTLANWPHAAADLVPFAAEVAEEFSRAREALTGRIRNPDVFWDEFRRRRSDLPDIRWPAVWERVFDSITRKLAEEEEARRKAAPKMSPFGLAAAITAQQRPPIALLGSIAGPSSDHRATAARRYDELVANNERAQQRAEDYEAELGRLKQAHAEIVRPDARLWWGVAIVMIYAISGVALPLWVMSRGPQDLAPVRWVFYPFAACLAALIFYIVVYLVQLTRSERS